jgi:hypothetical protein
MERRRTHEISRLRRRVGCDLKEVVYRKLLDGRFEVSVRVRQGGSVKSDKSWKGGRGRGLSRDDYRRWSLR